MKKKVVKGLLILVSVLVVLVIGMNDELSKNYVLAAETSKADYSPNIIRHEGYSRENVAENVARAHFMESNKVIIVNRDTFSDAISATNISQGKYPVLYTHKHTVSQSTIELLEEMALDEIYILGGTFSVNETVKTQLEDRTGIKVTRIAGYSRYDANVAAINENYTKNDHVVIASGEVYSDALYGVSYANNDDAPVVLTKKNQLEKSTIEMIKKLGVKRATIIGGTLTVTKKVEDQLKGLGISHDRIAGRNRYIGSAEVARYSTGNHNNVVIASGEVFTDALISAPLAQKLDAPILLVKSNEISTDVKHFLFDNQYDISNIYIQGGTKTISKKVAQSLFTDNNLFNPIKGKKFQLDLKKFNEFSLKYINNERKKAGVAPLIYDESLQKGTNLRAYDLFQMDTVGHMRPDGTSYDRAFTYLPYYQYQHLGENAFQGRYQGADTEDIDAGRMTLEESIAYNAFIWLRMSPGHYQNMVNSSYTRYATSTYFEGANWKSKNLFNVQIFSGPEPKITIEKEVEMHDVDYADKYIEDPNLFDGLVIYDSGGELGIREVVYEVTYINGHRQGVRRKKSDKIIKEPVTAVYSVGVPNDDAIKIDTELFNTEFLKLLNEERTTLGLDPLQYEPTLQRGVNHRTDEVFKYNGSNGYRELENKTRVNGSSWLTVFDYLNNSPTIKPVEEILETQYFSKYDFERNSNKAFESKLAELTYENFKKFNQLRSDDYKGVTLSAQVEETEAIYRDVNVTLVLSTK